MRVREESQIDMIPPASVLHSIPTCRRGSFCCTYCCAACALQTQCIFDLHRFASVSKAQSSILGKQCHPGMQEGSAAQADIPWAAKGQQRSPAAAVLHMSDWQSGAQAQPCVAAVEQSSSVLRCWQMLPPIGVQRPSVLPSCTFITQVDMG